MYKKADSSFGFVHVEDGSDEALGLALDAAHSSLSILRGQLERRRKAETEPKPTTPPPPPVFVIDAPPALVEWARERVEYLNAAPDSYRVFTQPEVLLGHLRDWLKRIDGGRRDDGRHRDEPKTGAPSGPVGASPEQARRDGEGDPSDRGQTQGP